MGKIGLTRQRTITDAFAAIVSNAKANERVFRAPRQAEYDVLFNISRLIWRNWVGRLPTGIDRVCLAYLEYFADRAQAVVQRGNFRVALTPADSQTLFQLLLSGSPHFRRKLLAMAPMALMRALLAPPPRERVYLNIGHTGLDSSKLTDWVTQHALKPVYFIHDIIPITHPEFCRAGEGEKHRRRMVAVLSSAAGIIANSQKTLDDVTRFARSSNLPTPPGTVAWLSGISTSPSIRPANLGAPHFITIGTIEGRKNQVLLLRLWKRLAQRLGKATPKLVIVGQRGWEADHAIAMLDRCVEIREHVLELGRCEDEELARLIKGARALLMPSFTEGFGLPVIEALELGTPVIASNLPVFHEIAGEIPTYLESYDGKGWEEAVLAFLEDCPERERQKAAIVNYQAPDWRDHFAGIEKWLECEVNLFDQQS